MAHTGSAARTQRTWPRYKAWTITRCGVGSAVGKCVFQCGRSSLGHSCLGHPLASKWDLRAARSGASQPAACAGKRAKSIVFRGCKTKTRGGLQQHDLMRSKRGIIARAGNHRQQEGQRQERGIIAYTYIEGWTIALQQARHEHSK